MFYTLLVLKVFINNGESDITIKISIIRDIGLVKNGKKLPLLLERAILKLRSIIVPRSSPNNIGGNGYLFTLIM